MTTQKIESSLPASLDDFLFPTSLTLLYHSLYLCEPASKTIRKEHIMSKPIKQKLFKQVNVADESLTRVSARIDDDLYLFLKRAYKIQGVTMEERINTLLKKEAEYILKQKWYIDYQTKKPKSIFDQIAEMRMQNKNGVLPTMQHDADSDGSDFDIGDLNDGNHDLN
ncbi:hypothetical protein [Ralstonia pseudosolanacearum]